MPLLETKGAASAQGFGGIGGGSSGPVNYIEDVFSTYLYTGNGSTQTITNGIDLSTKGGLVWMKSRSAATDHALYDTVRGATKDLVSNSQAAETTQSTGLTSFASTGFSIGALAKINTNAATYVSWTFREQPKFFDVVTWSGAANQTISHSLGSTPGCIIVKRLGAVEAWWVYHRSVVNSLNLNTSAAALGYSVFGTVSSTSFQVFLNSTTAPDGYVAYLFAHNAGGFGLSGTDNVISCGSITTNSSGDWNTATLGYEPQWLMLKRSDGVSDWMMMDNMRGFGVNDASNTRLSANLSIAESASFGFDPYPNATGFGSNSQSVLAANATYIYIAIRRGPMKVPTSGTSVFGANARSGTGANATVTGGQIADAALIKNRGSAVGDLFASRLTGTGYLETSSTAAEVAAGTTILQANPWDVMDGVNVGTTSTITNASGNTFINYLFRRAPGFFDVVCYTGTGATQNVTHNLGVAPELMILKRRNGVSNWATYAAPLGNTKGFDGPNTDGAAYTSSLVWNNTTPTSSVFTVGTANSTNQNAATYVAYLFATCAGVSKVGSYTGTGALQTINCGFTGGASFVLIKRTDSTGDWYVYDSARGISSGNDPYLLLNSTAAEVTGTNYVDTTSVGFQVTAAAPAGLNANGGTYIFLAIA